MLFRSKGYQNSLRIQGHPFLLDNSRGHKIKIYIVKIFNLIETHLFNDYLHSTSESYLEKQFRITEVNIYFMHKILILEKDKDLLEVLQIALHQVNYNVLTLNDVTQLYSTIKEFNPQLLMLDINRRANACKELLRQIAANFPALQVIALNGNPKIQGIVKKLGIFGLLPMPFTLEELYHIVDRAITGRKPKGN